MRETNSSYLFVYGTLMQASGHVMHQILAEHAQYICSAYLFGRLYEIHGYPGAIQSRFANERVYGELYQINISPTLLARLDDYEECSASFAEPHEYQRKIVKVYDTEQHAFHAWTYLYNWPVNETQRILSGRYQ